MSKIKETNIDFHCLFAGEVLVRTGVNIFDGGWGYIHGKSRPDLDVEIFEKPADNMPLFTFWKYTEDCGSKELQFKETVSREDMMNQLCDFLREGIFHCQQE